MSRGKPCGILSMTDLKGDVLIPQPDFKLLLPILILLRPFRIVFFHDLAVLDDPLDLRNQQGTDAHCLESVAGESNGSKSAYSLSG